MSTPPIPPKIDLEAEAMLRAPDVEEGECKDCLDLIDLNDYMPWGKYGPNGSEGHTKLRVIIMNDFSYATWLIDNEKIKLNSAAEALFVKQGKLQG